MLYSDSRDEYFSSPEDAEDSLEEGQTLADLKLRICNPKYARPIDCSNWHDQLPDDDGCDAPDWLEDAIEQFNAAISVCPLSWYPGKVALKVGTAWERAQQAEDKARRLEDSLDACRPYLKEGETAADALKRLSERRTVRSLCEAYEAFVMR